MSKWIRRSRATLFCFAAALVIATVPAATARAGAVTLNDGSTQGGVVLLVGSGEPKISLQATGKPIKMLKLADIKSAMLDGRPGELAARELDGVPWARTEVGDAKKAGSVELHGAKVLMTDSSDGYRLGRQTRAEDAAPPVDSCCFAFQKLEGDGEIVARVLPSESTKWMRAGLLICQGLDGDGPMAYVARTADPVGAILITRSVPKRGGPSLLTATNDAKDIPEGLPWLKLTRSKDVFKAYESYNGLSWSLVGEKTIPMDESKGIYIGVAATGNSREGSATFESIRMTGSRSAAAVAGLGDTRLPDVSVTLQDGSVIAGTLDNINDAGQATIVRATGLDPLTVPATALARAQYDPLTRAQVQKFLSSTTGLMTRDGDFLDGDIKELKTDSVTVSSVTFGLTTMERSRVFGLVFPAAADTKIAPGSFAVRLDNGSMIAARKITAEGDKITLDDPVLGPFHTTVKEVVSIEKK